MKRTLKNELRRAFEAPEPQRKRAFLRTLEQPGPGIFAFVLSQTGYVRRWVWIVSALVFMLSTAGAAGLSADKVWIISALMPMLALTVVSESGRSENYGMAELEMATRFSLRSVVLARLGILGVENLLILGVLTIGIWRRGDSAVQAGAGILLPYLMTTFAGLAVVRRKRGREAVYICVGIAVLISSLMMAPHGGIFRYYQMESGIWRTAAVLLLLAGTAGQCAGIVSRTEAA